MHDKKFKFRFNTLSLCFLIGMSLVGCRDFNDVRKLGERSSVIEEQSTKIANDFYDSCVRRSRIPQTRPFLNQNLMPSEALSSLQLDREYNQWINLISEKRAFAQTFADYLEETRKTHRNITLIFAENRDLTRLNQEKKPEIIPAQREVFCADYEARSREESVSTRLTPSEVERIVNLLKDCERTTAPMIEKMKQIDFEKQPLLPSDR